MSSGKYREIMRLLDELSNALSEIGFGELSEIQKHDIAYYLKVNLQEDLARLDIKIITL